jgi:hypothetical protein
MTEHNGNGKQRRYAQIVVGILILGAITWRLLLPEVAILPFVNIVRWAYFTPMALIGGLVLLAFTVLDLKLKTAEPIHNAAMTGAWIFWLFIAFFGPQG